MPQARHRDAWAVEKKAPTWAQFQAEAQSESHFAKEGTPTGGVRRMIPSTPAPTTNMAAEVLVVVSKMKQYVKERADMNTSGDVADILSDLIRRSCDEAIDRARAEGRKTLMARDFAGTPRK